MLEEQEIELSNSSDIIHHISRMKEEDSFLIKNSTKNISYFKAVAHLAKLSIPAAFGIIWK